jgi:CzcA family heavy metal efflux pump
MMSRMVAVGVMLVLSPVIAQLGNLCALVSPAGVAAQPTPTGQAGHTHTGADSPKGQGTAESPLAKENMMTLNPERLQAVGVKFELAKRRPLDRTIRTVGQVEIDERRLAHVNIKLEGWIDQLFVSSTGERVTRGQKLLTLYSPELVATQTEYLLALKSQRTLGGSAFPEVAEGAESLAEATRRRLQLWDITEDHIQDLERTGKVQRTLPIHAPQSGTVIKKVALAGMHVNPGDELYTIADLSHVWLLTDIYEYELPFIKVGQTATVTLSYDPKTVLQGRIAFLYPTLDTQTRTAKVRFELANPSDLIRESIATASDNLLEELLVVSVLIVGFLLHLRSALIPILTLPLAVLISFIPMYFMGIGMNIMSIGGIIVAIGDMVDAAIIMVDNAHKRLEEWARHGSQGDRTEVLIASAKEVGPAIFASLLVIAIAFMPVFTLEAQEGRLFKPLAFTKNLAIAMSAVLAITLIPAIVPLLVRGRIIAEQRHPVSWLLQRLYAPILPLALRLRWVVILLALGCALTVPLAFQRLGSEFMPPLYEGTILYMPTTLPGLSVTAAAQLLQKMDRTLKGFPEVERVFGKAGRAETSTDPAPFSMMEVVVQLKPREQWRPGLTYEGLVAEMDKALQLPGVSNAWTMPIKARIDMLTTGVRTPVGIKIFGPDLKQIEEIGKHLEMVAQGVPGTRSVYAERVSGGYFLDFDIRRDEIARYGLTVMDVGQIIESAIGGESIATTIEGRERYPINVRYPRELRDTPEKLRRVLVTTPTGTQVPLAQLTTLRVLSGPAMIRDENGMLSGYVYVDMAGRDIGGYVEELKRVVRAQVALPPGYTLAWSGQYEFMQRVQERLKIFVPLTIACIFILFYFAFRSVGETLMVMLGVPFALVGGVWYLVWLEYNMSIAVWVGLIALAGIAAETSAVMLAYLDEACAQRKAAGQLHTFQDVLHAVHTGAVERIRPMAMAGLANILGLIPVMWATGTGADVMKRLAAPMVGGVLSAMLLTLVVMPALYVIWRWHTDVKPQGGASQVTTAVMTGAQPNAS